MLPAGRPGGGAVLIALPAVLHSPALLLPLVGAAALLLAWGLSLPRLAQRLAALVGRGADVAAISTRAFARQGLQVNPPARRTPAHRPRTQPLGPARSGGHAALSVAGKDVRLSAC